SHSSAGASAPPRPSGTLSTTMTSGRKDLAAASASCDRTARVSGRLMPSRAARTSPALSRARRGSLIVSTRGGSGYASSIGAPVTISAVARSSSSVTASAIVSARRRCPRPTHSFVKKRYFSARLHEADACPGGATYQIDTTGRQNLTEQVRSRRAVVEVYVRGKAEAASSAISSARTASLGDAPRDAAP